MKSLPLTFLFIGALAAAVTQPVVANETNYFFDGIQTASPGSTWTAIWTLNTSGTNGTLVAPVSGRICTTVFNGVQISDTSSAANTLCTELRIPYSSGVANPVVFPGDSLVLGPGTVFRINDLNLTSNGAQGGLTGTSGATALANSSPIVNFPGANGQIGLVLNGGVVNSAPGVSGACFIITGTMQAATGATSYLIPSGDLLTGGQVTDALNLNAKLTGNGTLVVFNGLNTYPSLQVTCTSNAFTGQWLLQGGWLQGVGDGTTGAAQDGYNSLGTNSACSILVNPLYNVPSGSGATNFNLTGQTLYTNTALLDLGSSVANSAGTLTLANNGQMWIHGEYIFSAVTITNTVAQTGTNLPPGYYPYSTLTNLFPANFAGLPSIFTTVGGGITVQTPGPIPAYPPLVSTQPANQALFPSQTAQFSVSATVPGPIQSTIGYQWYTVDSTAAVFTPLNNGTTASGAAVSGATTASLSLAGIALGDATNFAVVVSNTVGSVTSSVAFLTVTAGPANETNYFTFITNSVNSDTQWTNTLWVTSTTGNTNLGPTSAAAPGGVYTIVTAGTQPNGGGNFTYLRNPTNGTTETFPGDSLVIGPGAELRMKALGDTAIPEGGLEGTTATPMHYSFPTNNFPGANGFIGLVMNGGILMNPQDSASIGANQVVTGTMEAAAGTQSYFFPGSYVPGSGSQIAVLHTLTVASQLSGSGTLAVVSGTNVVPGVQVTGTSNYFTGAWLLQGGWLQGVGDGANDGYNSLGTNSTCAITVDPFYLLPTNSGPTGFKTQNTLTNSAGQYLNCALLDLGSSTMNSAGTLTLTNGGQMWLHGQSIFSAVTINGTPLANGYYDYTTLTNLFPANFTGLPAIFYTFGGGITVRPYSAILPSYAPLISQQPSPATLLAYAGRSTQITAAATGSGTLGYQWYTVDGTGSILTPVANAGDISGATSNSLVFSAAVLADATNYALIVSNSGGSVTSAVVSLTVVAPETAYETNLLAIASTNLVAYWRLNEQTDPSGGTATAFDYAGGFNGVYGANCGDGFDAVVGPQAPAFPGFETTNSALQTVAGTLHGFVTVPTLNLDTNELTIMAWIYPTTIEANAVAIFMCRAGTTVSGMTYAQLAANGQYPLGYNWAGNSGTYTWNSGIFPPQNAWSLVALSITPTNATMTMVNSSGLQTASQIFTQPVQNFDGPSQIGSDANFNASTRTFAGSIDEVAILKTALSPSQVLSLYSSAAGLSATAPTIEQNPVGTNAFVGDTVQFTVLAAGATNLAYQWQAAATGSGGPYTNLTEGGQFSGTTNATLTISNISAANALDYVVTVTNLYGSTNSDASPATLVVNPVPGSGTITLNYAGSGGAGIGGQIMAGGSDWNTAGYWWDGLSDGGLSATVLAAELPGIPFVVPGNSSLRTPANAVTATFPGAELDLLGDGNYTYDNPTTPTDTTALLILKAGPGVNSGSSGEVYFTNLVVNGGRIGNGNPGVATLDGKITIGSIGALFLMNNGSLDDRGWQVNSQLTGSGTVELLNYSAETGFQADYTNDLDIACSSNTFNGSWNVVQGVLLGGGNNSLGTNNIVVGPYGALETMYDVNNTNASLTLNGVMFLHQNDTFQTMAVGGATVYAGTYSAAAFTSAFPANFPASWSKKYGSIFSSASGSITVLQPPRPTVTLGTSYSSATKTLTLTWSTGTLLQATNVLGPWVTNSAATSPWPVSTTNSQMYFRILNSLP